LLLGRKAAACDVNSVAYCVTRAKNNPPPLSALRRRLSVLQTQFERIESKRLDSERRSLPPFFRRAFSTHTLRQILFLRHELQWQRLDTDGMIAAITLGQLHGESDKSSSYLSNQMPRTISTKPDYSIRFWERTGHQPPRRDVFEVVRKVAAFRYESPLPEGKALVFQTDMRNLPRVLPTVVDRVRCVVTSPPYFDVTDFEEDQWLRLWFLGGKDHPKRRQNSRDDRHSSVSNYWSFIADMWRSLGQIIAKRGHCVIRLGASRIIPDQIPEMLLATARFAQRRVQLLCTETSPITNRQTGAFRPDSRGCRVEVDCHFQFA
jgi:hypothetical protein